MGLCGNFTVMTVSVATKMFIIEHFTVACLVVKPFNRSKVEGGHVVIEISISLV